MELRFPIDRISELAKQYDGIIGVRDRRLEEQITNEVFPSYLRDGYLTREGFLTVCAWKTPRSKPHCESNDAAMVSELAKRYQGAEFCLVSIHDCLVTTEDHVEEVSNMLSAAFQAKLGFLLPVKVKQITRPVANHPPVVQDNGLCLNA